MEQSVSASATPGASRASWWPQGWWKIMDTRIGIVPIEGLVVSKMFPGFETEDHGVKVLIDPKSLPYLDGTELDFVREGLNEGFKFHNPREKDRCGCGESFRV